MKNQKVQKIALSGLFLSLCLILPFLTGQIPKIGNAFLPMHLPVMLCGFICGFGYGFGVGLVAPILRGAIFGMPALYPTAVWMAVELATEVCFNDSNHSTKCTARKMPLAIHIISSFLRTRSSSFLQDALPHTTGESSSTVQSRRQAAITAEGAWDSRTNMAEREMPSTPTTIIQKGCFSMYLISHSFLIAAHTTILTVPDGLL